MASALHPTLEGVNCLVSEQPECLAHDNSAVKEAALAATKYLYDLSVESEKGSLKQINELLGSLQPAHAPQTRSQAKRKRSLSPANNVKLEPTPLETLYTGDMDDNQIWAQLELRVKRMCDALSFILEENSDDLDELPSRAEDDFDEALMDMEMDEDDSQSSEEESDDESPSEGEEFDEEDESEELEDDEGELELRDESGEEEEAIDSIIKRDPPSRKQASKKHVELDDDFFSLETFNAETERAEARSSSRGKLGDDDEDDESDLDDEEIDLFAPLEGDISEDDDMGLDHEPMYSDFFDPLPNTGKPVKSKGKAKKSSQDSSGRVRFNDSVKYKVMRDNSHSVSDEEAGDAPSSKKSTKSKKRKQADLENLELAFNGMDQEFGVLDDEELGSEDQERLEQASPAIEDEEESDEGDSTRATMQRFQEDLFADEEEDDEEGLSTFEKRQAELQKQIADLEAENVGPKDWTLMGEANSRTRPQNSLLEEDLEFERATKVTPMITEEVVQGLEERIKARIVEGRFDDVVRLRKVDDKPFLPSKMFELKDTKSNQSLAQLYEDDFVAAQGGPLAEDRDGKLKKEHDEIEKLWERLCGKLDALCNAHFTPKQPKAVIETITNLSTTSLESALPTTKSATTMLAPEEVYAPSSSAPVARSEMTPAQKRALRGKERKQKKKTRDALERQLEKNGKPRKSKGAKQDKKEALQSIVKTGKGVTVIGKDSRRKADKK